MKRLVVILALSCTFFYGCQNNKNQTPISELINLEEWDSITIAVMKEKMQLDTLQYIGDDIPSFAIDDDIIINSFDEHIRYLLKFREKEIAALLEHQILSNEGVIYIHESQGDRGPQGFVRYFVVMPINEKFRYVFTYKPDVDSFLVEKKDDFDDYYIEPVLYYGIEEWGMTGIKLTTKITKDKNSKLSYEIIGLVVD